MRRTTRSKPVAVLGERRVPSPLQNLHHRLLDEAIQHGWDAKLSQSVVREAPGRPPVLTDRSVPKAPSMVLLPAPPGVRETPTPSAWSPSCSGADSASRLRRASTTSRTLSKSSIKQRPSRPIALAASVDEDLASNPPFRSVQAAGINVRLPSGKITRNSGTPRLVRLRMTKSRRPSNTCRLRMMTIESGSSW